MASLRRALLHHACLAVILLESASAIMRISNAGSTAAQSAVRPGVGGLMKLMGKKGPRASSHGRGRVSATTETCKQKLAEFREAMKAEGYDVPCNGHHTGIGKGWFGQQLYEGSIPDDAFDYIAGVAKGLGEEAPATICQTGFNYGLSALALLCATPEGYKVRSWDIGEHEYTQTAQKIIDEFFPGRHQLTLGNSTRTLKEEVATASEETPLCDLAFVDGGRSTKVCEDDILNFRRLSKPDAKVYVDDCAVHDAESTLGGMVGTLFPKSLPLALRTYGMYSVNLCFKSAVKLELVDIVDPDVSFTWSSPLHHMCVGQFTSVGEDDDEDENGSPEKDAEELMNNEAEEEDEVAKMLEDVGGKAGPEDVGGKAGPEDVGGKAGPEDVGGKAGPEDVPHQDEGEQGQGASDAPGDETPGEQDAQTPGAQTPDASGDQTPDGPGDEKPDPEFKAVPRPYPFADSDSVPDEGGDDEPTPIAKAHKGKQAPHSAPGQVDPEPTLEAHEEIEENSGLAGLEHAAEDGELSAAATANMPTPATLPA